MEKNARIAAVGNLGETDIITFSSGTGVKHKHRCYEGRVQWSLEGDIA
jgi:hypothetical protein